MKRARFTIASPEYAEHFWSQVDKTGDCWVWTRGKGRDGYGSTYVDGRNLPSSRVAWILARGPIPDGLLVCHRCDNPPCCNPDHLFLGTYRENALDCAGKDRIAHGERSGQARLTLAKVIRIRELVAQGETDSAICERFGVVEATVYAIRTGHTWRRALAAIDPSMALPVCRPPGWVPSNGKNVKRDPAKVIRGSRKGLAKLDEAGAAEVYRQLLAGESHRTIAARHGISHTTVYHIAHGKKWRHVTGLPAPAPASSPESIGGC